MIEGAPDILFLTAAIDPPGTPTVARTGLGPCNTIM
jgi:hypothetical protein